MTRNKFSGFTAHRVIDSPPNYEIVKKALPLVVGFSVLSLCVLAGRFDLLRLTV